MQQRQIPDRNGIESNVTETGMKPNQLRSTTTNEYIETFIILYMMKSLIRGPAITFWIKTYGIIFATFINVIDFVCLFFFSLRVQNENNRCHFGQWAFRLGSSYSIMTNKSKCKENSGTHFSFLRIQSIRNETTRNDTKRHDNAPFGRRIDIAISWEIECVNENEWGLAKQKNKSIGTWKVHRIHTERTVQTNRASNYTKNMIKANETFNDWSHR